MENKQKQYKTKNHETRLELIEHIGDNEYLCRVFNKNHEFYVATVRADALTEEIENPEQYIKTIDKPKNK